MQYPLLRQIIVLVTACATAAEPLPSYKHIHISLDGNAPTVFLHLRGDRVTGGWMHRPPTAQRTKVAKKPSYPLTVFRSATGIFGTQVKVDVASLRKVAEKGMRVSLTNHIHFNGKGDTLNWSGTYTWGKRSGTFKASTCSTADLPPRFTKGYDFPCHRGHSGGGGDIRLRAGTELVDTWDQARLLWVSEEPTPGAYYYPVNGGYNTPVIYDGRAYVTYSRPTGTSINGKTHSMDQVVDYYKEMWRYAPEAVDVICCFDGNTGATVWKREFSGGINQHFFDKASCQHQTPACANGVIVAQGTSGKVFCLQATTGKTKWIYEHKHTSDSIRSALHDFRSGKRSYIREQKNALNIDSSYMFTCTQIIEGVAIAGTTRSGLIGIDIKSGKKLWSHDNTKRNLRKGVSAKQSSRVGPLPWRHAGRTYVVTDCRALDPRSGETIWQIDGPAAGLNGAIAGDILVVETNDFSATPGRKGHPRLWAAYRMGLGTIERLWQFSRPGMTPDRYSGPVIHRGIAYLPLAARGQTPSVTALDIHTGAVLGHFQDQSKKWKDTFNLSPIAMGEILVTNNGQLFNLAGRHTIEHRPNTMTQAPAISCHTSPAAADGCVIVRLAVGTACFDFTK